MINDMKSLELEQMRNTYQSQEREICKTCKERAGLPCLFVFSCELLKQVKQMYKKQGDCDK